MSESPAWGGLVIERDTGQRRDDGKEAMGSPIYKDLEVIGTNIQQRARRNHLGSLLLRKSLLYCTRLHRIYVSKAAHGLEGVGGGAG